MRKIRKLINKNWRKYFHGNELSIKFSSIVLLSKYLSINNPCWLNVLYSFIGDRYLVLLNCLEIFLFLFKNIGSNIVWYKIKLFVKFNNNEWEELWDELKMRREENKKKDKYHKTKQKK